MQVPVPEPRPVEEIKQILEHSARVADILAEHVRVHAEREEWAKIIRHFDEVIPYYVQQRNQMAQWMESMRVKEQYPMGVRIWREGDSDGSKNGPSSN